MVLFTFDDFSDFAFAVVIVSWREVCDDIGTVQTNPAESIVRDSIELIPRKFLCEKVSVAAPWLQI